MRMVDCNVNRSVALVGGGALLCDAASEASLSRCTIHIAQAASSAVYGSGGAILARADSVLRMSETSVSSAIAGYGGCVYVDQSLSVLEDCSLSQCLAEAVSPVTVTTLPGGEWGRNRKAAADVLVSCLTLAHEAGLCAHRWCHVCGWYVRPGALCDATASEPD